MSKKAPVPKHVGIIMDGNRRWARRLGKPPLAGHARGYERAREIAEHAFRRGVRFVTLFAFSTENWKRSKTEVSFLMSLMKRMLAEQAATLHERGIRLRVIGSRRELPGGVQKEIDRAERATAEGTRGALVIAVNYGGRADIVGAAQALLRKSYSRDLTEHAFEQYLQTRGIPDPDLIIRTSGEERLSGFLLWQSAYSELYFSKTLWPEFTKRDFDDALAAYARRRRRLGA